MRRRSVGAILVGLAGGVAIQAEIAVADVPVDDSARNTQEKSIADCSTRAKTYRQETVLPAQGTKQSVATPGASNIPTAGNALVTGVGASGSSGVVSGIDFSKLPVISASGVQNVGGLSLSAIAQAVNALTQVKGALQSNHANTLSAAAMMGALALSQSSWNQNTAARISSGGMWNQIVMTAVMTAQLFNQRTLQMTAGSSAAAGGMTFNPLAAAFTAVPVVAPDSNAQAIPRPGN
jgi:hypothetical protein